MSENQDSAKQRGAIEQKVSGLKRALSDGPTRLVFLGGIALAFIVAVFALNAVIRGPGPGDGSAQLTEAPEPVEPAGSRASSQPVNTAAYDELTAESNAQAAAQAKESGGTAMPVPRVGEAKPEAAAPSATAFSSDANGQTMGTSAAPQPTAADAGTKVETQQMREEALAKRYQLMANQYDKLVQRWASAQMREGVSARGQDVANAAGSVDASVVGPGIGNTLAADTPTADIRATETFLGLAISEANTDDQLPIVRVKLLNGPAKGAVMMGSIEAPQATASGGLIRFSQLTPAGGGATVSIDAIAIDPRTSRSSVASSVNRHTVSRLGALFFSSMLSGVSEGLLKGGQEERVITSGQNVVVQRDAYSDRDLALIGLGKVGTNGAQMMQGAVNRRPTVKLNLNTEIGVLFLKDVFLETGAH